MGGKPRRGDRHRRWGIGGVLGGLVLISLVPFVLLEAYRGALQVRDRREAVARQAAGQLEEEAETLTDFLRFTERYLATLAADPAIRTLDTPRIDAYFQEVRALNPNYENIFLLSLTGEQLASTAPLISDPDAAERPYFQEALRSGRMALSDALVWQDTERSVVVFAQPVTGQNGQPVAVLCVALNLARLSSVIGYVALPKDSVVLLVQRDGTVIAASESPVPWVGRTVAGTRVFADSLTRWRGTSSSVLADDVPRVIAFQSMQHVPWLLMAGVPRTEVDAALRETIWLVGVQLALAGLATAAISWIVLRRVVIPIRMLSEGARAFAAGFLNRRVPLRRRDELGDLADSLNSMAAALDHRLEEEAAHAQALRDLNRLQTEFVATASHELRTPVTAIRTYAEALMRPDLTDEATRRECLDGIDRSSERLARLVRTLLDVSRIDSGRVTLTLEPVDVGAVARAAVAQAAPDNGGHDVTIDVPSDLPQALADADRLEDVLANVIGNARKFSPPGAPVRVQAQIADSNLQLAIEDRGAGIPADELERVFDRFYQVHRGADRRAGGSGLGLYIARAYVTAMHGRIWVESTPGVGSTFFVTLPVASGGGSATQERADAEPAGVAPGG
jgi:signal transduction histidine kinase